MALVDGFAGRDIDLLWNGSAIGGVREKSLSLNGEGIDTTDDDSDGRRQLLANISARDEVNISVSGVTKSRSLKQDWFARTRTRTVTITYPDGDAISGTFWLASYTDTGPFEDATTFEAELQSSGEVTYVAGP